MQDNMAKWGLTVTVASFALTLIAWLVDPTATQRWLLFLWGHIGLWRFLGIFGLLAVASVVFGRPLAQQALLASTKRRHDLLLFRSSCDIIPDGDVVRVLQSLQQTEAMHRDYLPQLYAYVAFFDEPLNAYHNPALRRSVTDFAWALGQMLNWGRLHMFPTGGHTVGLDVKMGAAEEEARRIYSAESDVLQTHVQAVWTTYQDYITNVRTVLPDARMALLQGTNQE